MVKRSGGRDLGNGKPPTCDFSLPDVIIGRYFCRSQSAEPSLLLATRPQKQGRPARSFGDGWLNYWFFFSGKDGFAMGVEHCDDAIPICINCQRAG